MYILVISHIYQVSDGFARPMQKQTPLCRQPEEENDCKASPSEA